MVLFSKSLHHLFMVENTKYSIVITVSLKPSSGPSSPSLMTPVFVSVSLFWQDVGLHEGCVPHAGLRG